MSELLFFVLGLVIGGLIAITLMCCVQINRINDMEIENEKLKRKLESEEY